MNGDVWKTLDWKNSELQGNYNSETDNIKIRHGKKDGIAYIFCSSNSLYKKDDRQDFVSKVVNKDKFEWENITQDIDHEKIIYIRDIWLSWYVVGVNVKYNTIDALIKKMREETEGMQVITVGVSSGGFIAAILASALKANYCLDFAGQFSLLHHWTHVDTNPFLKELYSKNNHCFGEAYLYLGESPIYYFEPALCEQAIEQAKYAKMCSNVKILRVRSKTHGCAISPVALRKVMSYDVEQMEKLYQSCENKMKSSLWFSVKTAGVQNTLIYFGKKILKKLEVILRKDY